jgi:hypothetical protein
MLLTGGRHRKVPYSSQRGLGAALSAAASVRDAMVLKLTETVLRFAGPPFRWKVPATCLVEGGGNPPGSACSVVCMAFWAAHRNSRCRRDAAHMHETRHTTAEVCARLIQRQELRFGHGGLVSARHTHAHVSGRLGGGGGGGRPFSLD